MQKYGSKRKKGVPRNIAIICIVVIFLSTPLASVAYDTERTMATANQRQDSDSSLYQPRTYHNATLFIVSNVYYVNYVDEDVIHLSRRYPFLPGIFYVEDKNGTQEFTLMGGWAGTRVEIHGFEGFLNGQGLYTVLIGNCTKISIIPIRGQ